MLVVVVVVDDCKTASAGVCICIVSRRGRCLTPDLREIASTLCSQLEDAVAVRISVGTSRRTPKPEKKTSCSSTYTHRLGGFLALRKKRSFSNLIVPSCRKEKTNLVKQYFIS